MPRLDDTLRAALGYWWNLISDAALQGFTVTETVSIANQVAKDLGGSLSFAENSAISSLYGYARRGINAGNTLKAAAPEQGITAEMITSPPWARTEQEQVTYPLYHVRFTYTALDQAGNEVTLFKTSVFPDVLPGTVGELTADVLDDAEAMAQKYNHTLLSVELDQIMAV
jgi:hypothetical protein